jgi:hypothetical protein
MSLLLVTKILPPSDEVCDQNNIIFSPLQASIEYKWINYGDMWAQGSQYRTSFNTSISDETDKAWLGLLTGRRRLLCRPRLNDWYHRGPDVDVSVPKHQLLALGQKTWHHWKVHPNGGYSARLGGFYQMNCLVCYS